MHCITTTFQYFNKKLANTLLWIILASSQLVTAETTIQSEHKVTDQQRELMTAIIAEDVERVKVLLTQQPDMNFLLDDSSPLIRVAANGHSQLTSLLLNSGADPNITNSRNATALMNAAYLGHAEVVELLIQSNADIRIEHKNGFEAFDFALEKPHIDIMLRLIRELAKTESGGVHHLVEYVLSDDSSIPRSLTANEHEMASLALMATVIKNDNQKLQSLLSLGVSPNWHNMTGYAALPLAARLNQRELSELLLSSGANIDLGNDGNDEASALNQAARSANHQLLDWLLMQGASVNKANARGYTALHLATYRQCIPCIETLLQQGANIALATETKETASSIAEQLNNEEIIRLIQQHRERTQLIEKLVEKVKSKSLTTKDLSEVSTAQLDVFPSDGRPLLSHLILNQPGLVTPLLNKGVDVNQAELTGLRATPLMYAVSQNDPLLLKQLIDRGADINKPDRLGNPAIDWASYYGYESVVALLLERGAIIANTSPHGDAIDIAIRRGHRRTATLIADSVNLSWTSTDAKSLFQLIERKDFSSLSSGLTNVSLDQHRDPLANTPLHYAVMENCLACAEMILNHGLAVDLKNRIGMTPLMIAAQQGSLPMLELLLIHKADVNAHADERGMKVTPLMLSAIHNQQKAMALLLAAGAQVDAQDTMGNTAALWALGEGQTEVAQQLIEAGSDTTIENEYGYSVDSLSSLMNKNQGEEE